MKTESSCVAAVAGVLALLCLLLLAVLVQILPRGSVDPTILGLIILLVLVLAVAAILSAPRSFDGCLVLALMLALVFPAFTLLFEGRRLAALVCALPILPLAAVLWLLEKLGYRPLGPCV